jgi:hypothetical protein
MAEETDRYFDLTALSDYSGMSVRSLQRYLTDAEHPLPHHYIRAAGKGRGRCLVYKREFDQWVCSFPTTRKVETAPDTTRHPDAVAIARSIRSKL